MARHLYLQSHLPVDELERRYRAAHEPHERSWWQILWLLAQGHTATSVAAVTGYSAYWIGQLAQRYNQQGPAGMHNRQHSTSRRAAPLLSVELQEELRAALAGPAPEDDRWSGRTVAEWMSARLGRPVSRYRGWIYLNRLKPKPRHGVPRPRHALADPEEQADFKKNSARS
jgi:transposase